MASESRDPDRVTARPAGHDSDHRRSKSSSPSNIFHFYTVLSIGSMFGFENILSSLFLCVMSWVI